MSASEVPVGVVPAEHTVSNAFGSSEADGSRTLEMSMLNSIAGSGVAARVVDSIEPNFVRPGAEIDMTIAN